MRAGLRDWTRGTLVLVLCASASTTRADTGSVQLSIADCAGVSGAEIGNLVALELAPRERAVVEDVGSTGTRASLRCTDTHASVTVENPRQAHPLVLELELADVKPEARPRFVALAIAELIATSDLEPGQARPAPQPPPPPPAPPATEDVSETPPARLELWLAAGAVRGFAPALYAPALSLGVSERFAPFSLDLELGYEHGQQTTQPQRLTAQDVSLGVAPALHATGRHLDFGFALGLRAGYAWLAATPSRADLVGHTLSGFFFGPMSSASLTLRATPHVLPRIALEAAYVVKSVRGFDADAGPLLAVRGLWLCALLGLAWAP